MPDPENIKNELPDALRKALEFMRGYPKASLISIRKALNYWQWHPLLGRVPENWDSLPNYKKPWMDESTVTRCDYIRPYMTILELLGVSHIVAYGL